MAVVLRFWGPVGAHEVRNGTGCPFTVSAAAAEHQIIPALWLSSASPSGRSTRSAAIAAFGPLANPFVSGASVCVPGVWERAFPQDS